MKAIAQNKLTKRLVLLFLLMGVLAFLRQPSQAFSCDSECVTVWDECKTRCDGNQSCINGCTVQEQACFKTCPPDGRLP
jgi:hypothetical protein